MLLFRGIAKTRRGRRFLLARAPQVIEGAKRVMFIRGPTSSEVLSACVKDLAVMAQPNVVKYGRKSDIRPFEDPSSVLFYSHKSDAALFAHTSSSKKRPSNLTLGRIFAGEILDMFEFGVEQFVAMHNFRSQKAAIGFKPCILLDGPEWENSEQMRLVGNFLVDFFQGAPVTKINLAGLDHVISLSSRDGVVHFRQYSIALKKSGSSIPRVELTEMGPSFDLKLRRSTSAAPEIRKESLRVPPQLRPTKRKNVSTNVFGEKIGRIHMPRQELDGMMSKKIKGLKAPAAKRRRTAAVPVGQDASNDY